MKTSSLNSLALLVLSAIVISGCRAKTSLPGMGNGGADMGNPTGALPVPQTNPASPFLVTARSKQAEFARGAPVELEIEVKNVSKTAATLQFTSGQSFDFSATRIGDKETAWNWAMDKMFMQSLHSQTLKAGESLHFDATWQNAAPGRYRVTGRISSSEDLEAAPFTVVVK